MGKERFFQGKEPDDGCIHACGAKTSRGQVSGHNHIAAPAFSPGPAQAGQTGQLEHDKVAEACVEHENHFS